MCVPAADGSHAGPAPCFIGVVDASGSMRTYWADVVESYNAIAPAGSALITFDQAARLAPTSRLESELSKHGGGMTNIPAAFRLLEERLAGVDPATPVTVLFISDGQDNTEGGASTLEKRLSALRGAMGRRIMFLCLGIQSAFPTFLAMQLRERYGTACDTAPPLFLVEYAGAKAFANKAAQLAPYVRAKTLRAVHPAVHGAPWAAPTASAPEGAWVLVERAHTALSFDNALPRPVPEVTVAAVTAACAQWVGALETAALAADTAAAKRGKQQQQSGGEAAAAVSPSGEDVQRWARVAAEVVRQLVAEVRARTGTDLLGPDAPVFDAAGVWVGADAALARNHARHARVKFGGLVGALDVLAAGGASAGAMAEFEAAKRIGTGTILGKYEQRVAALAPAATTALQTTVARDFAALVLPAAGSATSTTAGLATLVAHAPAIARVLPTMSLFDAFEALPLCGRGVEFARPPTCAAGDVWVTSVRAIAPRSAALVDTASMTIELFQAVSQGFRAGGWGGVLPLLPKGAPLGGPEGVFLRSHLCGTLCAWEVTLNADVAPQLATVTRGDALCAVLAAALAAVLNRGRAGTALPVTTTTTSSPADGSAAGADKAALQCTPDALAPDDAAALRADIARTALASGWPRLALPADEACAVGSSAPQECLSAALLAIAAVAERGLASRELLVEAHVALTTELFRRVVAAEGRAALMTVEVPVHAVEEAVAHVRGADARHGVLAYYTCGAMAQAFEQRLTAACTAAAAGGGVAVVKTKALEHASGKVTLYTLQASCAALCGAPLTAAQLMQCAATATGETPAQLAAAVLAPACRAAADTALAPLRAEYAEAYERAHRVVLPISTTALRRHAADHGLQPEAFAYDAANGLCVNACMARGCPHYLRPESAEAFERHMRMWRPGALPGAFHLTCRRLSTEPTDAVVSAFLAGRFSRSHARLDPAALNVSREAIVEYAQQVCEAYRALDAEDAGAPAWPRIASRTRVAKAPAAAASGATRGQSRQPATAAGRGRGGGRRQHGGGRGGRGRGRR